MGTPAAPHTPTRLWRRAAGRGRGSLAPIGRGPLPPRPWAPCSPGEVASWRAGCGAAAPGSAAGLAAVAGAGRAPGGARRPSPALPSSRAAPARSSLLPVSPPPPASTPRSATSASGAGRPPAARALPPLLCDEGRVSDLTEPPPPPPRGAAGMEPLSHRGLPRLSWIDTLYSSTCALGQGRPGGKGPRHPALRLDGPGARDAGLLWGAPRGLGAAGTAAQVPGGPAGGRAA